MTIREYRTKYNLSVIQIAADVGVSRQHLTDIENGRAYPSRKLARKIVEWSHNEITSNELLFPSHSEGNSTPAETPLADSLA